MFGRQELKNQIEYYKGMYEQYADKFVSEKDAREAMYKELDQALESGTAYESQVVELTEELTHERDISQALADENTDLTRQLELLQALLKQLSIAVKLPVRKK
jgi:hypothetical protein